MKHAKAERFEGRDSDDRKQNRARNRRALMTHGRRIVDASNKQKVAAFAVCREKRFFSFKQEHIARSQQHRAEFHVANSFAVARDRDHDCAVDIAKARFTQRLMQQRTAV